MLNLIVSVVTTFLSLVLAITSFLRGPIVVGLIAGCVVMSFATGAEAAVYAPYQCNNSACPVFAGMSFSELFGLCSVLVGIAISAYLYNDSKRGN